MGTNIGKLFPYDTISINKLRGKTLAIDGFYFMYQFLGSIRQRDGTPLKDSKGRITSHLSGFFYRTIFILENQIKPIYVFDGEPPKFKKKELEKRKKAKQEAEKKLKEAMEKGNIEQLKKYAKRTSRVLDYMVEDVKKLLTFMGIPYVQAPSEGEAQAAYLCQKDLVWSAVSSDYDSLLFGSKRLVKDLHKDQDELRFYELDRVLRELRLTRVQLIVAGILSGCDYTPEGLEGIGPKRALDIAKRYSFDDEKDFEKVEKYVKWGYDYGLKDVVEFYLNPPVEENVDLTFKQPNKDELIKFLCEEHDFSEKRVQNAIEKLEKASSSTISQSSLFDFM